MSIMIAFRCVKVRVCHQFLAIFCNVTHTAKM